MISRKIGVVVKSSNFNNQALTSHFENFWSIVDIGLWNSIVDVSGENDLEMTDEHNHIKSIMDMTKQFLDSSSKLKQDL